MPFFILKLYHLPKTYSTCENPKKFSLLIESSLTMEPSHGGAMCYVSLSDLMALSP